MSDHGFWAEDENGGFVPTAGGLLDGLPDADNSSSLPLFMNGKGYRDDSRIAAACL